MAGPVQAPLRVDRRRVGADFPGRPDGTPTTETRYRRDLRFRDSGLALRVDALRSLRDLDGEFVNLQRQGGLALFASCRGQEAAQIGATACLRKTELAVPAVPRDRRVPAARDHRRPGGRVGAASGTAGWDSPRNVSRRSPSRSARTDCTPSARRWPPQRLGEDSVTLAFLGDGATSEGDVHEALNLASVFKAPCVFFVQNNQWAISVPVSRQMAGPSIAHRAIGYGMPGVRVDGNDVLACHAVTAEAAKRARDGGGPTLIEAITYRMGPHTTSDDPPGTGPTRKSSTGRHAIRFGATAPTCRRSGCGPSASRSGWRPSRSDYAPNCAKPSSTPTTSTSPRCSTPSTTTSPRTCWHSATRCWQSWRRSAWASEATGGQEHDTDHRAATAARRGRARAARRARGTAHPEG